MAKILYAEDTAGTREFVEEILEEEGHDIIAVSDGQQALKRLEDLGRVDLVITDIDMPNLDGYLLIEELNKIDNPPPVIVHSSNFDKERIQYSGKLRRIGKECSPYGNELRSIVKELLEK